MIQLLGWKDDPTKQPQPKRRGTGGGLDQFVKEMIEDDPSVKDRIKHGVIQDDSFKPSNEAPLRSVKTEGSTNDKNKASLNNTTKSPFDKSN